MVITKEVETAITRFMDHYWETYMAGDIQTWSTFLTEDYKNIGGTEEEIWNNKKEIVEYSMAIVDQLVGVAELRNKRTEVFSLDPFMLVHEFADMYIKIQNNWSFYGKFRLSSILQQCEEGWKVIHQHGSYPDSKTGQGEAFAFDKISTENRELKDAIKRRTIELEQTNRELEIEASLERVRTVAMGMKKPEDMLDVCRVVSTQLQSLGCHDIRNIQTAIFYELKGIYLNYEYFPLYDKTVITEVEYNLQPDVKAFANRMQQDPQAFFTTSFEGKKLTDWIEYQKETNQFVDPILHEAGSLHYYFYSIGPGALGISTYTPLSDENLNVFRSFRNVFELSYRRFMDIEQALAQAREAKIEAALERIRSRAMAMHKTEELLDAAELVSKELSDLGIESMNVSYAFVDEDEKYGSYYSLNPVDGKIPPFPFIFPHTETEVMRSILSSWKKQEPFNVIELDEEASLKHQTYIGEHILHLITKNNINIPFTVEAFLAVSPKKAVIYTFNFTKGYLFNIGAVRLTAVQEEMLLRFTKVFDHTYTRFLDLQKAEAQAKEARIELGLERVRARAMAMQNSGELAELVAVLFTELTHLDFSLTSCIIWIHNKEHSSNILWIASAEMNKPAEPYYVQPFHNDFFRSIMHAWKARDPKWIFSLAGIGKENFEKAFFNELPNLPDALRKALTIPKQVVFSASFNNFGALEIVETEALTDEKFDILHRFGKVFDSSYTRFNDLQKAEAQAKEAQIELGLERVRARAMAMQTSVELKELIGTVFTELTKLDLVLTRCLIMIFDPETAGSTWWMANSEDASNPMGLFVKYHELPPYIAYTKGWEQRTIKFQYILEGTDKEHWDDFIFVETELSNLPGFVIAGMKAPDRVYLSASFNNFGCLSLASLEPLPGEHTDILLRFAKVFDLTYTRFNDLQKAEAQAREAKIEAALEKVRSRSLAMHTTNELGEVVKVIVEKLQDLGVVLDANGVILCTYFQDSKDVLHWIVSPDFSMAGSYLLPHFDHPIFNACWHSKESGDEYFSKAFSVEEKNSFFEYAFEHSDYKHFPEEFKQWVFQNDKHSLSFAWQKNSAILIPSHTGVLPTEADKAILIRFSKVFEQAYVRFLDMQKAEAQAREAKIEAALERTRTQSMIMQHSNELDDTLRVFHEQVLSLGIHSAFSFLWLPVEKNDRHIFWAAWGEEKNGSTVFESKAINYPLDRNEPATAQCLVDWKSNEPVFSYNVPPDAVENYFEVWHELIDGVDHLKPEFFSGGLHYVEAFMKFGCFGVMVATDLTDDEKKLLSRFANEFERTYTRFLDLQKSEAQAREAQIELGLERVRARAMAMQSSEELSALVDTVFKELTKLDFAISMCIINIIDESTLSNMVWAANPETGKPPDSYYMKFEDYPFHHAMMKGYKERNPRFIYVIEGDEKTIYDEYLFNETEFRKMPKEAQAASKALKRYVASFTFSNFGGLQTVADEVLSNEKLDILARFGKVFDLTYTRFNDLLKAEAQAREGQIELALERVRARTMAMQKSEELKEVIQVVYQQFVHLNIHIEHTGFIIDYKARDDMHIWLADKHEVPSQVTIPYFDCAHWNSFNEAKEKGTNFFANELGFEEKNKFYQDLFKLFPVPEETKEYYFNCPGLAISTVLLENVGLYIENFSGIPYTEDENNTLMRFGKVFQQTYTRFLDLQKAEAQARESQIQLALERVRARSMAMHKSEELADLSLELVKQVQALGVATWFCAFNINDDDPKSSLEWGSNGEGTFPQYRTPREGIFLRYYEAGQRGETFLINEIGEKECPAHYEYLCSLPGVGNQLLQMKAAGLPFPSSQIDHVAFFKYGYLIFITYETAPEAHDVFKRFAKVFEQTYTRFLDLQKAEAQAREAKIEAALEKVRSRTMAMQNSDELPDAANVLFLEAQKLGIPAWSCGYNVLANDKRSAMCWMSSEGALQEPFTLRLFGEASFDEMGDFLRSDKTMLIQELADKAIDDHYNHMKSFADLKPTFDHIEAKGLSLPTYQVNHLCKYTHGFLLFITYEQVPDAHDIFKRFTKVFEQTYTRFLDLQKAEAQTREAKIEMALEKVRARTMGMQKSGELADVAKVLFTELNGLVDNLWTCGFVLCEKERNEDEWWLSMDDDFTRGFFLPNVDDFAHATLYEGWLQEEAFRAVQLDGSALQAHYDWLMKVPVARSIFEEMDAAGLARPEWQKLHAAYFSKGYLVIITREPSPGEEIFKRFAQVFDLTYTRFLDLQKAEAQAREAKIEASLERVRAKTMAMYQSENLGQVAEVVFKELESLDLGLMRCGIGIINKEKRNVDAWLTSVSDEGKTVQVSGTESIDLHPLLQGAYDAWLGNVDFSYVLEGEDLVQYYKTSGAGKVRLPDSQLILSANEISTQYYHLAVLEAGGLFAFSSKSLPEEAKMVMKRFAAVFNQSYTRFLDLQKAEAQARESQIEAALERVRSRTLAMQKSGELPETAAVLFRQLIGLGIQPNRLYIALVNDDAGNTEFWITDEDGSKVSSAYVANLNDNPTFKKILDGWRAEKKSLVIDMQGEELQEYFKYLSSIQVPFKGGGTQKRRVQEIAYFSKGFIGIASPDEQTPETIFLLERFASVFNLTYTRFNDLKIAEAHAIQAEEDLEKLQAEKKRAEDALTELRATQNQLIQSEKMASLGELTAGIAHEIQNPLNFVNNFSEVSNELIDEMMEEVMKGNYTEVKAIADDVKQNLSKINHHGKRADGIVKGMLQHSRTSSGQKEPTNINVLADEYLRLAYHGLRAKDKSFNATLKTDYDESIGNINIIPQDIGRVILNLITNAFYAVNEKTLSGEPAAIGTPNAVKYEPTVSIKTKKMGDSISISVIDNGNGIPQKALDKIFQPFFTTKPTGQGTGLGLSLSYDIIKTHGGELMVETEEGEGSEFIIQLPV